MIIKKQLILVMTLATGFLGAMETNHTQEATATQSDLTLLKRKVFQLEQIQDSERIKRNFLSKKEKQTQEKQRLLYDRSPSPITPIHKVYVKLSPILEQITAKENDTYFAPISTTRKSHSTTTSPLPFSNQRFTTPIIQENNTSTFYRRSSSCTPPASCYSPMLQRIISYTTPNTIINNYGLITQNTDTALSTPTHHHYRRVASEPAHMDLLAGTEYSQSKATSSTDQPASINNRKPGWLPSLFRKEK